jgi:polysaccharide biosynthesis transport protein
LNGSLQTTDTQDLLVMTSGELPPNPAELLDSEKMGEIIRQIGQEAEVVIIDSPPVIAVTDSSVLAPRVDGVLLVFKLGVTHMGAAYQTVDQLQRLGANLLGVVLNEVDLKRSHYYYSHYKGYYHASSDYYHPSKKE